MGAGICLNLCMRGDSSIRISLLKHKMVVCIPSNQHDEQEEGAAAKIMMRLVLIEGRPFRGEPA